MIPNEFIFFLHVCAITISIAWATYFGERALITLITIFIVLANLFVTQTITLVGFTATSSDVFTVGCGLALLMLQEKYGKNVAQKAVWISFGGLIITLVLAQFHLWYLPAATDFARPAFNTILGYTPRIFCASIFAYIISQYANIFLYSWLQKRALFIPTVIKTYLILASSNLLDTLVFSVVGLYGVISPLSSIIFVSYAIKIITVFLTVPLSKLFLRITHSLK